MIFKRGILSIFFTGLFLVLANFNSFGQEMMSKESTEKPIVAVIKADWCPYCKRVDPVIASLMEDYEDSLNFVIFDVTDKTAVSESMKKAKDLGLEDFFKKFKGKTSTVAVLVDKEVVYKTSNNSKREDYVKAFDKALE